MREAPTGRRVLVLAVLAVATARSTHGGTPMALTLTSTAFSHHGEIPTKYTCEGTDVSPPLAWLGAPPNAKSLVLIVDDPDAPDPRAPKMTWVHWVLFNMPPDSTGMREAGAPPAASGDGLNDWKSPGWRGPCPPVGKHRYVFKLYALDTTLDGLGTPTKAEVERAMEGHVIEKTELVGTYEKKQH